ncbi:YhcN/YlaJ family sporulation lipoprotein [Paenibacillus sp. S-38]|uniref:YhcN/YlaJ family sporulation lipoprotein n=1 Tax=Paenibacillus sp. S-38 TaxID=3416710 RepID=UPI003CEE7089
MARALRLIGLISSIFTLAVAAGCYSWYDYNSANNYGSKRDMPRQDTSRAYQTQQQYAPVSHKVTKLEMNQNLSDQVAAMDGVNSAIVLVGDSVAYTAITMDNSASGTHGGDKRALDSNKDGRSRGENPAGDLRTYYVAPTQKIDGVSGAQTELHHEHLTHLFKQKIAEKIRSMEPAIHDVYITADPYVIDQFTRLAIESWHGRSLSPFIPDFVRTMERTFGTDPTIPNQAEGNGREY